MAMHMLWLTVPALLLSVALVRRRLVWIWQWCHLAKMGSDSGKITIREGFAIEWTLTQVNKEDVDPSEGFAIEWTLTQVNKEGPKGFSVIHPSP